MTVASSRSRYLDVYQRRRAEILELAQRQLELCDALGLDAAQAEGQKPGEQLRGVLTRLETERLTVLVIGQFNSGKSTFLNALLGEPLLPASRLPTTALPCEIRWAPEPEKRGVLYRKYGPGERKPVPLPIPGRELKTELARSVVLKDGVVTTPYERAEVYWPLELSRHGVHLIDTVGLNDPERRDEITFGRVPTADTVLYCIPATAAFTGTDKNVLERLRSLGYRSIFFVVTHYSVVRTSAQAGELPEEEFRRRVTKELAALTELEESGVKYVDSLDALIGRQQRDPTRLEMSGIEGLETALERFLADEKGRAKLRASLFTITKVNREVRQKIPLRIAMWQSGVAELAARYDLAAAPLRNLDMVRSLIMTIVDNSNSSIAQRSADLADQYMLALPQRVRGWANSYTIEQELPLFPSKEQIRVIVDAITTHVHDRATEDLAEWSTTELSAMISSTLEGTQRAIQDQEQELFREAERLRREIAIASDKAKHLPPGRPEPPNIAQNLSLSLDGGSNSVSVAPGARAAVGTIVMGAIGMSVLGLMAFLNPVTIGIAIVGALLGGSFFGKESAKDAIKEKVGDHLAKSVENGRADFVANIRRQVTAEVRKRRDLLDSALKGEISSIHGEVTAILKERQKGEANADREVAQLRKLEKDNLAIEAKVDDFRFEADPAG